jgi:hypothetical protein
MGAAIEIGLGLLKWIWNHKTLAALIGVVIFAAVQTSRLNTRTIQYNAASSQIDAAEKKQTLAEADTARWQKAAEARLQQIVGLSDQMTRQNASVASAGAARAKAEQFAAEAATEAATAQAALNDLTLHWEERAHAHPEDVRPLGPIACAAYASLYGDAAACRHPAGPVTH